MIEFVFTLLFFFIVFFMIVDLALMTYDKGMLNRATYQAARAASLYWVNPVGYQTANPSLNIQLNPARIMTVAQFYHDNILVNPGKAAIISRLNGSVLPGSIITQPDSFIVQLSHQRSFIGLFNLGMGSQYKTPTSVVAINSEKDPSL